MRVKNNYDNRCGISLKIYPSTKQKKIITLNDGASRFVYNRLVASNKELYAMSKAIDKVPCYQERTDYIKESTKDTASLRNAVPFLNLPEIDSCAIANAKANYNQAWDNFKKVPGTRIPTFHKKDYQQSYQTNAVYNGKISLKEGSVRFVDKSHIKLPKLGVVRFSASEKRIKKLLKNADNIKIGTVTIRKDATGAYYIALQFASNDPFAEPFPKTGKSCGIDVNLRNYLTDSHGKVVDNPRYYRKSKEKLAKAQRKSSLKLDRILKECDHHHYDKPKRRKYIENSSNYQKQRIKTANIQKHVANQRDNFLHELSTLYVKNHDIIVVEDLKPSNMKKNHKLALSISDAAWGTFLSMLEYKAKWYGKTFIKVPPQYTTQTCSNCGHVMKGEDHLTLAIEEWVCPKCGKLHIRDHNAAKVILEKGLIQLLSELSPIA